MPTVNTVQPAWGSYAPAFGMPVPTWVTGIELSGYAATPMGWVPFGRVRLDPAQTMVSGRCTCPLHWRVNTLA